MVGTGQKLGRVCGLPWGGKSWTEWEWVHEFLSFSFKTSAPRTSWGILLLRALNPLAPCLCSSPKSWCVAGAIVPAASQSLPPQARTQPIALGLCLKIAQAPAICFCFSRQISYVFEFPIIGEAAPPDILANLLSSGSNCRLLLLTHISESFSMP